MFVWGFGTREPIHESTDAGRTWRQAYAPTDRFLVSRDLRVVDGDVWASSDQGVWIGRDLGASWSARQGPEAGQVVGDLERVAGDLWLSSAAGVYATSDEGGRYERVGIQGVDVNALALTRGPGQRNRLVAGTTWDTYGTDLRGNGLPASPDWGTSPRQGDPEAQTYFLAACPDSRGSCSRSATDRWDRSPSTAATTAARPGCGS